VNFRKTTVKVQLKKIFAKVCRDFEAELVEFNGEADHVHFLFNYPPKVAVSKLVNSLKGVSSRKLNQLYPQLRRYYWKNALWSPSYFAGSCGGAPLEVIKQYIESQKYPLYPLPKVRSLAGEKGDKSTLGFLDKKKY